MKSYRPKRLGEQIKRELAEIFRSQRSQFGDYFLTVTGVSLPKDLRIARVWVSIYDDSDRDSVIKMLNSLSGMIRYHLAGRLNLRRVPDLVFELDETLDKAIRIDHLLRESGIEDIIEVEEEQTDE